MTISRRTLLASLAAGPAATLMSRTAFAAYPERAIHLIVPFAAGGNADIVGRITGDVISKAVKQPVVVEHAPAWRHIVAESLGDKGGIG